MYDEAEYGDTLKSWVVPTYMLCATVQRQRVVLPFRGIKCKIRTGIIFSERNRFV